VLRPSQIPEKLKGVDAVCVVPEAWLLGFTEGDEGLACGKAGFPGGVDTLQFLRDL